jgi:hypothetical protein
MLCDDVKYCSGANGMFIINLIPFLGLLINVDHLQSVNMWTFVVSCKIYIIL